MAVDVVHSGCWFAGEEEFLNLDEIVRNMQYCIVLYIRLFPNMGDKTHPFKVYDATN